MIRFNDEIDANATRILNKTEYDKDGDESSDNESLNTKNPEFYQPPKRKRSTKTSDLPANKKPAQTRCRHLEGMSPLTALYSMQQQL